MFRATNCRRLQITSAASGIVVFAAGLLCAEGDIRASAPETVSFYFNVQKGDGLVTGLGERNFRLFEDGQPKVFHLEAPEPVASIGLLVEHSRASWVYAQDIQVAMQGFLQHAPEDNWYALATFSHGLEVRADFTKQTGNILDAYAQVGLPLWSEIDTYDVVYEMLDKMGKLPGRKLLILIGSGLDSFSEKTLDEVTKKVDCENVVIIVAGAGSALRGVYEGSLGASDRMSLLQAQAFLQMLADRSGGYAWFPRFEHVFSEVMQGIMQSIATQYRMSYETTAPKSGSLHKIKVEAFQIVNDKREDFRVLVRDGWR
jgi:VWFA-related protein